VRRSVAALQAARPKLAELGAVAVREGRELDLVSALEAAAAAANVEQDIVLETVNQRDLSPWEREIPVRLRVAGAYADVLSYLAAVERLPYSLTVQGLMIAARSDRPVGIVTANVTGIIYWQSKDAPPFLASPVER
jgi:Tfp pilus assembly protein PilO